MDWARQTIRWSAIATNLVLGLLLVTFALMAMLRGKPSEPAEPLWILGATASLLAVVALLSESRK